MLRLRLPVLLLQEGRVLPGHTVAQQKCPEVPSVCCRAPTKKEGGSGRVSSWVSRTLWQRAGDQVAFSHTSFVFEVKKQSGGKKPTGGAACLAMRRGARIIGSKGHVMAGRP